MIFYDIFVLVITNKETNKSNLELLYRKQRRNRPLDTPKRMIERRQREGERERKER